MIPAASREHLLETAFSDIPSTINGSDGTITLRPLSAGSFTLLGRLGNPMISGASGEMDQASMFEAIVQYVWIHSAELSAVCAVKTIEDIPPLDLSTLAFRIPIGAAFLFLASYQAAATRMSASLAEPEESEGAGKHQDQPPPAGLPSLFLPSGVPETPLESVTSSGSSPSSEPSPTSTPPMSLTEPPADGLVLPHLTSPPQTPP